MATGRFTFHKRHLYFSIVTDTAGGQQRSPPRFLQFLSDDGNILEEQELATNDYYNATGKVAIYIYIYTCTLPVLPGNYKRYLYIYTP